MGIRLAKSLEAFELKTILLRWRRFRAASFFGMARDELFRRARAMANSSWRAFCGATAIACGNTPSRVRYRLSAIRARLRAIVCVDTRALWGCVGYGSVAGRKSSS